MIKEPDEGLNHHHKEIPVKTVAPEKALGCPNCGAVIGGTNFTQGSQCPYCTSELLPQEEAYTETIANRSSFPKTQSILKVQKRFPILENIRGRTGLFIDRFTTYTGQNKIDNINRPEKITEEQLPFAKESFLNWITQRSVLLKSILEMPDEDWGLCEGKNQIGNLSTNIFIPLAHPSGKYSTIRISATKDMSPYSDRNENANFLHIVIQRFKKSPSSESVASDLFSKWDHELSGEAEEISDENASISFNTKRWIEDEESRVGADTETDFIDLLENLSNNPEQAQQQIKTFANNIGSNQWLSLIEIQEMYFAAKLKKKVDRIISQNSGEINVFEEPKLSADAASDLDERYHLDSLYQDGLSVESGVSISCEHCGYPISGYEGKKSFFTCPSCSRMNDIVKTKRLSAEVLRNRDREDLLVPVEYFVTLLFDVDQALGEQFLEILGKSEIGESEHEDLELLLAIIFLLVAQKNPHLIQYINYRYEQYSSSDHQEGFILFVDFTDNHEVFVHKDSGGTEILVIPERLRGKVLAMRIGDHDRPRYSGTDYQWYRIHSLVMERSDLKKANTPEEFEELFDSFFFKEEERPENPHWLDRFFNSGRGTIIGSEINYDQDTPIERVSGKLWGMIKETKRSIPPGNEIDNESFIRR